MRTIGALVVAALTAAIVFAGTAIAPYLPFSQMSSGNYLMALVVAVPGPMIIAFTVGLPAGLPIWLVLRRNRRTSSAWLIGAGALLAVVTYLSMVWLGMGQPSETRLTFVENLPQPFHRLRILAGVAAGSAAAEVFRRIAMPESTGRGPL